MSPDLRLILVMTTLAASIAAVLACVVAILPGLVRRSETVRQWLGTIGPRFARYTKALQREWAFLSLMIALILIAAFVFFSIADDVLEGDPVFAADKAVYSLMRSLRTPAGDRGLIAITELGDAVVVTTMGVVVAAWLAWKRSWRALLYWILAVAGGSLLNTAIKIALHRTRPTDLYHTGWDTFSFPSGHSTTNAVLYGFLAVLIGRDLPKHLRLPLAYAASLLVALIAFSRLYLGAHWLSDVAGGLAFGSLWVAGLAIGYVHGRFERIDAPGLLGITVIALAVVGGGNIVLHYRHDLTFYAARSGPEAFAAPSHLLRDQAARTSARKRSTSV